MRTLDEEGKTPRKRRTEQGLDAANAGPAHRLAARPAPKRRRSAPTPAAARTSIAHCPPTVTSFLLVQGPELAEAMFSGEKLVDNRGHQLKLQPGWYVVYVGKDRKWRNAGWAQPLRAMIDALPASAQAEDWHGCAVGLIFIAGQRAVEECNGHGWAKGPVCHVVSATIRLLQPVRIEKRGQAVQWAVDQAQREQIEAQLPRGEPICHDLECSVCRAAGSSADAQPARPEDVGGKSEDSDVETKDRVDDGEGNT